MNLFETKISSEDSMEISKVIESGNIGFGPNVGLFEDSFKNFSKKENNVACNSASAAAFMIFSYLKDAYGVCDVYTTSLGFTSPAWCVKHFGHNLIFVDVQEDLQFSSDHYRQVRINSKNKVVVMPVLYGGVSNIKNFNMFGDELIVVDSAHCVTPTIESDFIFFSFHPYKPICTSDGGMISTDDREATEYFKNYRNFGRINIDSSYNIETGGFKFYMNNLNATIGITQIKRYTENLEKRKINYNNLASECELLRHDKDSSFYFATAFLKNANDIIAQIGVYKNYPMLHKMKFYNNGVILPELEAKFDTILNLPIHQNLNSSTLDNLKSILNKERKNVL